MASGTGASPVLSLVSLTGSPEALETTYRSLQAQRDPRWEWVVVLDDVRPSGALATDARVRVVAGVAGGVGEQLTVAVEQATGRHVLPVHPGDVLADETVAIIGRDVPPDAWGYSDEVQLHGAGRSPDRWEKPGHSPEWLRAQPYAVRTAFLPRQRLVELGGVRPEAGTAAWYDAVLRLSEQGPPAQLHHVLLHRARGDRQAFFVDGDPEDHCRVVLEHCRRVGIAVDSVEPVRAQGVVVGQRLRRSTPTRTPSVSIVIPTRGTTSPVQGQLRCHVVELLRSLWVDGRYPDLEVVVVYDTGTPADVLEQLQELVGDHLVLVHYDDWFHFSRKCNTGALHARGEYLLFLNDDMQVISPEWVHELVAQLADPGVGGVGARLVFADGTLQHIGHHYGGGDAGHPLFGWRANTLALGAAAHVAGERVGVTAACMLVRAEDFLAVGGFSEAFPLNYNDVDLCLKIREAGFRLVFTPHAELFHYESQTRVARVLASELWQVRHRWATRMKADPYLRISRPPHLRSKFLQDAHPPAAPTTSAIAAVTDPATRPDQSHDGVVAVGPA